jgi:hypothetical protein
MSFINYLLDVLALYVFMEALHKEGKDGDHHKIGGMMVDFMAEP